MIVYMSFMGNTHKFVSKLPFKSLNLTTHGTKEVDNDYVVIVPTYSRTKTQEIEDFIDENIHNIKGVVGVGNVNFGDDFVFVAKQLSEKYSIPLLHSIEFEGNESDVDIVKKEMFLLGIT